MSRRRRSVNDARAHAASVRVVAASVEIVEAVEANKRF
jgi:hypothetical protein